MHSLVLMAIQVKCSGNANKNQTNLNFQKQSQLEPNMPQANGYFYLPFQHETVQELLDWVEGIFPKDMTIELPYDNPRGDNLNDIGLFKFVINTGGDRKWITVFFEDRPFLIDSSETKWTRFRMNSRADSIARVFDKAAIDLDGWAGPDSKDFTRPSTGEKYYMFLGGEQSKRTLTDEEAINEIIKSNPEQAVERDSLAELTQEVLAERYTCQVRVEACVIDGEITVPVPLSTCDIKSPP